MKALYLLQETIYKDVMNQNPSKEDIVGLKKLISEDIIGNIYRCFQVEEKIQKLNEEKNKEIARLNAELEKLKAKLS